MTFSTQLGPFTRCRVVELLICLALVVACVVLAVCVAVTRAYTITGAVVVVIYALRLWRLLPSDRRRVRRASHERADRLLRKGWVPTTRSQPATAPGRATTAAAAPRSRAASTAQRARGSRRGSTAAAGPRSRRGSRAQDPAADYARRGTTGALRGPHQPLQETGRVLAGPPRAHSQPSVLHPLPAAWHSYYTRPPHASWSMGPLAGGAAGPSRGFPHALPGMATAVGEPIGEFDAYAPVVYGEDRPPYAHANNTYDTYREAAPWRCRDLPAGVVDSEGLPSPFVDNAYEPAVVPPSMALHCTAQRATMRSPSPLMLPAALEDSDRSVFSPYY